MLVLPATAPILMLAVLFGCSDQPSATPTAEVVPGGLDTTENRRPPRLPRRYGKRRALLADDHSALDRGNRCRRQRGP